MSAASSATAAQLALPAAAPTMLIVLGVEVPVLALLLSLAGVVLARFSLPKPPQPLSPWRFATLTLLLCVIDIGLVIETQPGVGMAVAGGVGLGVTGMLVVRIFGQRIERVIDAMFGAGASSQGES